MEVLNNNTNRIYLRGDGNSKLGYGHIARLLAVAEKLIGLTELIFCINYEESKEITNFISKLQCKLLFINNDQEFFKILNKNDIVIIDGYSFSSLYFKNLKEVGAKVIYIDDLIRKDINVDAIINHTPGYRKNDYKEIKNLKLFLGPRYSIIRNRFLENKKNRNILVINNILISLGMSNTGNLLNELVDSTLQATKNEIITVLIGNNILSSKIINNKRVRIRKSLTDVEMVSLLDKTDIAIIPTSTIYIEALSRGCIVLAGYFTIDQKNVYKKIITNKRFYQIGNFKKLKSNIIKEQLDDIKQKLPIKIKSNQIGKGWDDIIIFIKQCLKLE